MADQTAVFGIDLGTTYSCIAYVDEYGKPVIVENSEGEKITASVVLFENRNNIVVGTEAKNSARAKPNSVVELVKRRMGEADWRWSFEGTDYSPEEISAYILKKVVGDAENVVGFKIADVVITCPAYFGFQEREATARAGKIAGLNVLEIINEPTAAAITFGLQEQQNQVVMVYDLGGGTFDITVIEIKDKSIRVVATGGDHNLGGKDWDSIIVGYLADEWMRATGSSDNPLDTPETLQDLWLKAEGAKKALTAREETRVAISHAGTMENVTLTRAKFDELTANLLSRTIEYTKETLAAAQKHGFSHIDQLLLVGGSTRMLQVPARLQQEFHMEPKSFDPDQSVAKGAALYGQKLAIGQKIKTELAEMMGTTADQVNLDQVAPAMRQRAESEVASDMGRTVDYIRGTQAQRITNVISHSFGIVATDDSVTPWVDYISNLVMRNTAIPTKITKTYGTVENNQSQVDLRVMENESDGPEVRDLSIGKEVGMAELPLPPGLPRGSGIEVTFDIDQQGRLHLTGRELATYKQVEATIETNRAMSKAEEQQAISRAKGVKVS